MKLIKFLSLRFIIILLLFSNTTWAQPKLTKKPATDLARTAYPLALKVKTPEDSAWINHETIATVIVGAAIMGSLGAIIKYRGALHRTVSNWLKPTANVAVQQLVEQITEAPTPEAAVLERAATSSPKTADVMESLIKAVQEKLAQEKFPRTPERIRLYIEGKASGLFGRTFAELSNESQGVLVRDLNLDIKFNRFNGL